MRVVPLGHRLAEREIVALLSLSVGNPTPEKLDAIRAAYRSQPEYRLLGHESGGQVVGLVGLELMPGHEARVRHIAVAAAHRSRGVGRALLEAARAAFRLRRLTAETDDDAVQFYRRCGFEVESLGEIFRGVTRYRCTWTRPEDAVSGATASHAA